MAVNADGAAERGVTELNADTGGVTELTRGRLTLPEVLAQSVANMAPSAAMALLPLLVFAGAGNGTWVSFVIALLALLCVGYCAAQFARRMNSAGSFYVWVSKALRPSFGHAAGWGLILGYLATGMATVYGFAIYGADLLTRLGAPGDNRAILVALFLFDTLLAAGVAFFDIGVSARTALILESLSVTIIAILCVNIWVHNGTVFDTKQLTLTGVKPGGILVGTVLAIFAFVGFESAGSLGVESKNSFRNIPRAILWSCLIVGLFYVVVSYSQIYGFQNVKGGILGSTAPLPDLATDTGIGFFAYLLDIGIICSMFACTLACINAGARLIYSMARDGMGHSTIGSVHRVRSTPHIAIAVAAVPMIAVPIITTIINESAVNATGWVGSVATFGFMLGYALVGIGAPVFLSRVGAPAMLAWILGLLGAAIMVFVFWANWLPQTIPGNLFPSLTGAYVWLPYIFLGWTAIGIVYYAIWQRRNPAKAAEVGNNYHTPEEEAEPVAAG
jgi:amino acid transporter